MSEFDDLIRGDGFQPEPEDDSLFYSRIVLIGLLVLLGAVGLAYICFQLVMTVWAAASLTEAMLYVFKRVLELGLA